MICIGDDETSQRMVENYDLLDKLQWSLLEGTIKIKADVLWVL